MAEPQEDQNLIFRSRYWLLIFEDEKSFFNFWHKEKYFRCLFRELALIHNEITSKLLTLRYEVNARHLTKPQYRLVLAYCQKKDSAAWFIQKYELFRAVSIEKNHFFPLLKKYAYPGYKKSYPCWKKASKNNFFPLSPSRIENKKKKSAEIKIMADLGFLLRSYLPLAEELVRCLTSDSLNIKADRDEKEEKISINCLENISEDENEKVMIDKKDENGMFPTKESPNDVASQFPEIRETLVDHTSQFPERSQLVPLSLDSADSSINMEMKFFPDVSNLAHSKDIWLQQSNKSEFIPESLSDSISDSDSGYWFRGPPILPKKFEDYVML
jgi:hypothetical protein